MAVDEAIFKSSQRLPIQPTLRFYGWSRPAVSLGHFQSLEREIDIAACRRESIDVVFRPTGGKAVFHDDDFTYAVFAGDSDALFPSDIMGTYEMIGRWLIEGLGKLGIRAELAAQHRHHDSASLQTSCFSTPSRFELLVDGKKICGSAQVRSRGVFLQHGSLLTTFNPVKTYDVMLPHLEPRETQEKNFRASVTALREHMEIAEDGHAQICAAFKQAFIECFSANLREGDLTPAEENLKLRLLQEKHGR